MLLAAILTFGVITSAAAAEIDLAADPSASPEEITAPADEPATDVSEIETAAPETEPAADPETLPATEAPAEAPVEKTPAKIQRTPVELAPTAAGYPEITRIAPTAKGLKITWNAFEGAYKYIVFIRKDGGGWKKIGETTATSFEHKNLTNNTTYVYTVRAADKNGKFVSTAYTTGWSFRWLKTPELLRAESVNGGQKLLWNPVEGAEVYRVFIKSGDKWIVAGTTDTCYCINSRVTSGKAYTYTVRCWDADNGIALSYFDTKGCTGIYVATPQITSFNAVSGGVTVGWDKVDGAAKYAVFRKLSTGWKRLGITDKTTFDDLGLRYSARYTYTVRCLNKAGSYCSGYNNAGWSFTHLAPPSITSVTYRDMQYTLKWNAQKTASYYRVYRKELGGKWKFIGKADRNTFTDTKAEKEGVYTYTVRTMDADDNCLTYSEESDRYYRMGLFVIGLDGTGSPDINPTYTCEVTEDELRRMVACIADGWMGAVEGDEVHKDILSYYNSWPTKPGGYTMQTHDAWCAAYTSAVWIRAGIAKFTGIECGCGRFIDVAKGYNIWVESDAYIPKVGDAIIYNWSDAGYGECVTGADHIGIVTAVNGSDFVVTEGNTGTGYVGAHDRVVNCQYIRGYITPNYKLIAAYLSLKARFS
jgi:hypothetical protein